MKLAFFFAALPAFGQLTYTVGSTGTTALSYNGQAINYRYTEGMVTMLRWPNASGGTSQSFAPPCTKTVDRATETIMHACTAAPVSATVTADYDQDGPDGVAVTFRVTNTSTVRLTDVTLSVLGLALPDFLAAASRTTPVDARSPVSVIAWGAARQLIWLDTPGPDVSIGISCSGTVCKQQPKVLDIAPGAVKVIRFAARFTTDFAADYNSLVPRAYTAYRAAYPPAVNWPDRRPIMAWWVADVGKKSATNPRGYLQNPALDVSDTAAFTSKMVARAVQIKDLIKARPVQPQGIIVWDLEGQEFIHSTTYIGDPTALAKGYAPEMDAAADQMFRVFSDAGYRVGVTIRPQYLAYGTTLPPTCTFSANFDYKSYFVKVDAPYQARFHTCNDPAGAQWTIAPDGNGGQTVHATGDIAGVTARLKAKIDYARARWGATLFYIDSAVWSGGNPIDASIIVDLARTYPDCLFIPEQESLGTLAGGFGYSDPTVAADPSQTPQSWAWVYQESAFAVAMGNCMGSCWTSRAADFLAGQQRGDIALYAQPTQIAPTQLTRIEAMIQAARQ